MADNTAEVPLKKRRVTIVPPFNFGLALLEAQAESTSEFTFMLVSVISKIFEFFEK